MRDLVSRKPTNCRPANSNVRNEWLQKRNCYTNFAAVCCDRWISQEGSICSNVIFWFYQMVMINPKRLQPKRPIRITNQIRNMSSSTLKSVYRVSKKGHSEIEVFSYCVIFAICDANRHFSIQCVVVRFGRAAPWPEEFQ